MPATQFEGITFGTGCGLVCISWRWRNWDVALALCVIPRHWAWWSWWKREDGVDLVMYSMSAAPFFIVSTLYWDEEANKAGQ